MNLAIHKEGRKILVVIVIILIAINYLLYRLLDHDLLNYLINLISLLLLIFFFRFFRKPARMPSPREGLIFSAADGKVVAVEKVMENEYFKEEKLMISVFMSIWNVHINWIPVNSKIIYFRYHPGKYLVARHPKSSELNERTSLVLETEDKTQIMVRQIAGIVARRIKYYAKEGDTVNLGDELGFIKFGSRVDIYLPPDSEPMVKAGDRVRGITTPIALLKKS